MASNGLLRECVQQLKSSKHDYEKVLGGSVEVVWQSVSSAIERHLRLKKGVGVPGLGKFSFIRDFQPLTPVFLLNDRFISSYGVSWKRPPPSLVIPIAELNMSVLGSEAGLPKDQVAQTLDAVCAFVGGRLQKGSASGRIPVGNVGFFQCEGKNLQFVFDPSFVKSLVQSSNDAKPNVKPAADPIKPTVQPNSVANRTSIAMTDAIGSISQLSLSRLVNEEPDSSSDKSSDQKNDKRDHHRHHKHKHRHSKSTPHLPLSTQSDTQTSTSTQSQQILPRFLMLDPLRAPPRHLTSDSKYARVQDSAYERETEDVKNRVARSAHEVEEIARRTKAAQLRYLQTKAEKSVLEREMNAFLHGQMEFKRNAKQQEDARRSSAMEYDAVKILPRDPIVTAAQRREVKLKLRRRLNDQVALKDDLAKQKRAVDQAESAYFLSKLQLHAAHEQEERAERQRIEREALVAGWTQQLAVRAQHEQLHPTRKHR
ncbi:hypothetical protein Poli38472_001475 [Pythium oligandrum]|uniref:CCDC81 HU domain-containing protein n=1 Tax=Pythium oligandrum TaxID=41045 RepID=A0A8K1CU75_PYTOL|nr:hypothetical protein Poli38472_001475 [Pythium oligandrum]|eukprot:TMW69319.1 hypothetical protein Poli38472_001475 [Pythium oligandrum]